MNEVIQTILSRRSVRNYKPEPPAEETLQTILEAGLYAPSAMNQQSWHFTVLEGEAVSRFLTFCRNVMGRDASFDPFYGAPVIVLAFGKRDAVAPVSDASLAMENMMLAAHSLGVSSCWVHCVNDVFAGGRGEMLQLSWGVPAGYVSVGSLALGYSAEEEPRQAAPRAEGTVTRIRE